MMMPDDVGAKKDTADLNICVQTVDTPDSSN